MLKVTTPFTGHGYNMPAEGALIDPPEKLAEYLVSIGVAVEHETKVQPLPEVKKNAPSESSQAARAPRKKTRKRSKKSAKKS